MTLYNTSDKYIREYISEKARILAVIWLNVNTFKPHTVTKTSVLFVQKLKEKEVSSILEHTTRHGTLDAIISVGYRESYPINNGTVNKGLSKRKKVL